MTDRKPFLDIDPEAFFGSQVATTRVTIKIGDREHDIGVLISPDPEGDDAREMVARMIIDWARGYAGEDADLDD